MAIHELFMRDENTQALINKDNNSLEQYKLARNKGKRQRELEQRVSKLEELVGILLKERELG